MNDSIAVADNGGGDATAPLPIRSTAEMIEILIYTMCLCVGGPLNIYSFRKMLLRHRRGRSNSLGTSSPVQANSKISAQNLLRLSLNIADLSTMFIYTLSQIIWMITYQWYAGDLVCRAVKFFHTFGFYLNSFVVACFAIDRAMGTRKLNSLKPSAVAVRRTRRMLTVAWMLAFVLSLPQSFIFRLVEVSSAGMQNFKQCAPIWTIAIYEVDLKWGYLRETGRLTAEAQSALLEKSEAVVKWERIYNIAHLLFVFWIPTLIIVTSYTIVICTLNSFVVIHGNSIGATLRDTIRKVSMNPRRRLQANNSTPRDTLAVPGATAESNQRDDPPDLSSARRPPADNDEESPSKSSREEERSVLVIEDALIQLADVECVRPTNRGWKMLQRSTSSDEVANNSSNTSMCDKAVSFGSYGEKANKKNVVGTMAMQTIKKARQKAKRQAALILLAYLTFWTPYNLLAIINAFSAKEGALKEVASVTLPFLNSLIVMNPIVNPLIYEFFERS